MKTDMIKKIEIPQEVTVDIDNYILKAKGPKGSNEKKIFYPGITIKKEDNEIVIETKKASKREKKLFNTLKSHIENMVEGVKEGYEYKLKICSGHFPMNVSIQNKEVTIKNFFGEKIPRKAKIYDNVEVKIDGDIITVNGVDKEAVGQTAANIEISTRRTGFDRRIFQDGIWITKKSK